jgi:hypothetical protein
MADIQRSYKEPTTRQERKNKGKFSTKNKDVYNNKHVRNYEKRIELRVKS